MLSKENITSFLVKESVYITADASFEPGKLHLVS